MVKFEPRAVIMSPAKNKMIKASQQVGVKGGNVGRTLASALREPQGVRIGGRLPWMTLSFGVAALVVTLLGEGLSQFLQYDRAWILQGEWWRLFTGHFTHWGMEHAIWDVLVFVVFGGFLEIVSRKIWLWLVVGSAVVISLAVLIFNNDLMFYRGLSGVDTALAVACFMKLASYSRFRKRVGLQLFWIACLLLAFAKPILEIALGSSLFVQDLGQGVVILPGAHLLGAFYGLLIVVLGSLIRRSQIMDKDKSMIDAMAAG